MDFEQARQNMIEQQIRTWDVLDQRVLDAIAAVPREDFVPGRYRGVAFAELEIPLGHGEFMMSPRLEARLLQSLQCSAEDDVLEVGTGSGYLTAVLARLGRRVRSIDLYEDFLVEARARLNRQQVGNVALERGDGIAGWARHAPYDVIAMTGSLPELPAALPEQLRLGGRLFVVVGNAPAMRARLVTRIAADQYTEETLFETQLQPLVGARPRRRFVL